MEWLKIPRTEQAAPQQWKEKKNKTRTQHLKDVWNFRLAYIIYTKELMSIFIPFKRVLGSARTGLIFTGIREGTQSGRLTPTWPNRAGYSIPCASFWVQVGGAGRWELTRGPEVHSGGSGSLGCAVCVVFSPYQYCCCSCSLCLLFA